MTGTGTKPKPPARATAAILCALFIMTFSLLFIEMNLRDIGIMANRRDFVRDEFEVDYFSQGRKGHTMGGHVVSTGERLSTESEQVIISGGLEGRRKLQENEQLVGHRFPVYYLPEKGFWGFVDTIGRFRIVSPEVFEASDRDRLVWLGVGATFWTAGILLFLWGVKMAKRGAVPDTTLNRKRTRRR